MVRFAIVDDRIRVIRLLKDSVKNGESVFGNEYSLPFDVQYGMKLFNYHASNSNCLNMVYVDKKGYVQGVLMAIADTHPFGPVKWAKESVWYIHPKHRGGSAAFRMLDAFEDWALKDQQCRFVGMGMLGSNPSLKALYERRGYKPVETYFLKELVAA